MSTEQKPQKTVPAASPQPAAKPKPKARTKRKPVKFSGSAKVTLTAVSLLSFIGGWNIIARVQNQDAQAEEPPATPVPQVMPTAILPTPTPWPTIAALPEIKPIPTLQPVTIAGSPQTQTAVAPVQVAAPAAQVNIAPVQIAPLPTLAPLPDMPAAPPPPPPMPVQPAGGWQNSGGS